MMRLRVPRVRMLGDTSPFVFMINCRLHLALLPPGVVAPSGSRLRALGRQSKKRKCVKKPAAKPGVDTTTTSTTIRPRPKSARKPPAKARGSIRESLKVGDPGQGPVVVPQLRKAKCKAASATTSAKSIRMSPGTTKPTSSGCENDDQHRQLE